MFEISKDFHISISHALSGLPDGHKCARMHGHNVIVRVMLTSDSLDKHGFVMDYGDLQPLQNWLDATLDHRHLNDVVNFQPSAENMAWYIFSRCRDWGWPISAAGWSETPRTWAWFR